MSSRVAPRLNAPKRLARREAEAAYATLVCCHVHALALDEYLRRILSVEDLALPDDLARFGIERGKMSELHAADNQAVGHDRAGEVVGYAHRSLPRDLAVRAIEGDDSPTRQVGDEKSAYDEGAGKRAPAVADGVARPDRGSKRGVPMLFTGLDIVRPVPGLASRVDRTVGDDRGGVYPASGVTGQVAAPRELP